MAKAKENSQKEKEVKNTKTIKTENEIEKQEEEVKTSISKKKEEQKAKKQGKVEENQGNKKGKKNQKSKDNKEQTKKQVNKKDSQKENEAKNKEEILKDNQKENKKNAKDEKDEKKDKIAKKQESNKNVPTKINKEMQEVEKEIKSNKNLPEEQLNQIHTRVFQNIFLAVIIILYLNFIILGFKNIENSVFLVDLKVFSMSILVIAIGVIEYAYKKDSGRHAIHGIETLVLAIATMGFIYLNMMWQEKFVPVVVITALVFAIYYVAKTIAIYKKMKKQFSLENIKEMIKK